MGGEGFLPQFVSISDIKNNTSLEGVIPLKEKRRVEEEIAAQARDWRRTAVPVSYGGMDIDHAGSSSAAKKPKALAPPHKAAS